MRPEPGFVMTFIQRFPQKLKPKHADFEAPGGLARKIRNRREGRVRILLRRKRKVFLRKLLLGKRLLGKRLARS